MVLVDLLSAGVVGLARYSYALDPNPTGSDQAGWGAPSDDRPDAAVGESKAPTLLVAGCWSGEVDDAVDGAGTATMQFDHNSNPRKLVNGSAFNFQWGDGAYAYGPVKGTVTATGVKFKGTAGAGCELKGSAAGSDTQLTGTVEFRGNCASTFQDVTFSLAPGC
jgi:hypothetical protein